VLAGNRPHVRNAFPRASRPYRARHFDQVAWDYKRNGEGLVLPLAEPLRIDGAGSVPLTDGQTEEHHS